MPAAEPHDMRGSRVALLDLYDQAVVDVYRYLRARCPSDVVAEDLTSETFLAAVSAVERDAVSDLTAAWLIGVARHKLVDHWRRQAREERKLHALSGGLDGESEPSWDPWDTTLENGRAQQTLALLGAHHRSALVLRYFDDLSVPAVAQELGRTVHATEALLVRARVAFRRAYEQPAGRPAGSASQREVDDV